MGGCCSVGVKKEDEGKHEGVAGTRSCGSSWSVVKVWGFT